MESRVKVLGHPVHPILIVLPLGMLIMAVVFDVLHFISGNAAFSVVAYWNIVAGVITGLLAAVFGFLDWLAIPGKTRAKAIGAFHGGGNVLVVLLFATSWWLRRDNPDYVPDTLAFSLALLGLALGGLTAWLGGELVYRLGMGVDHGANLNAPNSLSGKPASVVDNSLSPARRGTEMTPRPPQARRTRLLLGISIFWLALSILSDGLNSLVLPKHLLDLGTTAGAATTLGLLTFVGLAGGMLVQPVAGQWSDRLRYRYGRHVFVGAGVVLLVVSLGAFALTRHLATLFIAYLAVQVAASMAQAAQQGYIPDLVPPDSRGLAAGFKGFMDTGGATIAFILLGSLLAGDSIAPAIVAMIASLVATYLLAVLLVREPRIATRSRTRAGPLDAFRLDTNQHSGFVHVVAARFFFLLGTYAVGRFLLFFVAYRLGVAPGEAAAQAGMLLALLTLVTTLAAPLGGWAADVWGRLPLMTAGALLSMVGVLGLITASSAQLILLCGSIMALGSAAFVGANWALTTELAPSGEAARFMGLANFGTAGGAAAAGLLGPLVDWGNSLAWGRGYTFLFLAAAGAFLASILVLRPKQDARVPTPSYRKELL